MEPENPPRNALAHFEAFEREAHRRELAREWARLLARYGWMPEFEEVTGSKHGKPHRESCDMGDDCSC